MSFIQLNISSIRTQEAREPSVNVDDEIALLEHQGAIWPKLGSGR